VTRRILAAAAAALCCLARVAFGAEAGIARIGGTGFDSASAVAVDANGNIYLAGETASSDFPTAGSTSAFRGVRDAFVVKLDPTGATLLYATLLGGSEADSAAGIAVDGMGNVWVTGETLSPDFPTTADAFSAAPGGASDAFVAKLDPSGALLYSTRLGGEGFDRGNAVAVGAGGNVAVVGRTGSMSFPTTPGAVQPFFRGSDFDAFVTRFDPAGHVTSSTFLGGSENDAAFGVAVDGAAVWITGGTRSPDFPATAGAYQPVNFATDAFATKLDGAGGFAYSTFLGGSFIDRGNAIAVDSLGRAFVAGQAGSPDFPTVNAVQSTFAGGANDAFAAVIDPSRSGDASLVFSTYLGGAGDDRASGVAVGASTILFAGESTSTDFPLVRFPGSPGARGASDAFAAAIELGATPRLAFSAPLGGVGDDRGFAVAANAAGDAVVVGRTDSGGYPAGAARHGPGGGSDAFVVRAAAGGAAPSAPVPTLSPGALAIAVLALAVAGIASLRRF
jgi:beta-propeller repeat-containing protein